ncbi:VOC family protein [Streptomyces sp. XM83C]|jgi:predicted enzyme related to lactoylglutathione lyase|uniref:VOC family protein n=1 Tax=Streptomyces thermocoprophilus TaxID=78356 RepID=A0ABV5VHW8_9ACTN|nr:VOC family protein [Streptomyces sp. XM83C]MCK1818804.1 VOC family protein [Streptomyces sp. XM83C]
MADAAVQGIKTVLHPVADVAAAKKLYTAVFGIEPQTDSEYYVGFDVAGQHIGLVPAGAQGITAQVAYLHVADLDAKLAEITAAGGTVNSPAKEVGAGRRVATVTDLDGNVLGLLQDS